MSEVPLQPRRVWDICILTRTRWRRAGADHGEHGAIPGHACRFIPTLARMVQGWGGLLSWVPVLSQPECCASRRAQHPEGAKTPHWLTLANFPQGWGGSRRTRRNTRAWWSTRWRTSLSASASRRSPPRSAGAFSSIVFAQL